MKWETPYEGWETVWVSSKEGHTSNEVNSATSVSGSLGLSMVTVVSGHSFRSRTAFTTFSAAKRACIRWAANCCSTTLRACLRRFSATSPADLRRFRGLKSGDDVCMTCAMLQCDWRPDAL